MIIYHVTADSLILDLFIVLYLFFFIFISMKPDIWNIPTLIHYYRFLGLIPWRMMVLCGILLFHSDVKARFHFEKNNKTCNDRFFIFIFFFFLLEKKIAERWYAGIYTLYMLYSVCVLWHLHLRCILLIQARLSSLNYAERKRKDYMNMTKM